MLWHNCRVFNIVIALSTVLMIGSAIPYMVQIVRGTTRPRIVSWFTWTVLMTIACAASLAERQYASAILTFSTAIETLLIIGLGLKYGDRRFERFDVMCLASALLGVVLWQVFNSPAVAVVAVVVVDLVGSLPTLQHSWRAPHEETAVTYLMAGLSAICTLMVTQSWQITAIVYPAYIVLLNLGIYAIITGRKKYRLATEMVEA
jgi:hypothetical protein